MFLSGVEGVPVNKNKEPACLVADRLSELSTFFPESATLQEYFPVTQPGISRIYPLFQCLPFHPGSAGTGS